MNLIWNDCWRDRGNGGRATPGLCRKIVAEAGIIYCGPVGNGLVQCCRKQSWFPNYPSKSGMYHLHSSHYCFIPQQQSCLCLVQQTTPPLPLGAPCFDADPKSSSHFLICSKQSLLGSWTQASTDSPALFFHLSTQVKVLWQEDIPETVEKLMSFCGVEWSKHATPATRSGLGDYSPLSPPSLLAVCA